MDGLRATLDMTFDTGSFYLLLNRFDKRGDIGIASCLCGIQLLTDHIVGIVLQIFQRQVFKLALQLIEAQLMSQRCIEISRLLRHLHLCFFILGVTNLAHQVYTVSNHNENHTHILCKGEQQITEVLTLHHRILLVELLDAVQAMKDTSHLRPILRFDASHIESPLLQFWNQVNSLNSIAL